MKNKRVIKSSLSQTRIRICFKIPRTKAYYIQIWYRESTPIQIYSVWPQNWKLRMKMATKVER